MVEFDLRLQRATAERMPLNWSALTRLAALYFDSLLDVPVVDPPTPDSLCSEPQDGCEKICG